MFNKYIIVKGHPVLFSNELIHADVISNNEGLDGAGFFIIMKDSQVSKLNVVCLGESTSLSVKSRPEIDQAIIANFLNIQRNKMAGLVKEHSDFKCSKCDSCLIYKDFQFGALNYVLKFLSLSTYWCIQCKVSKWSWSKFKTVK